MKERSHEEELLSAYAEADASLRLRYVRISLALFLMLLPIFSILDSVVYPQYFESMRWIRIWFSILYVIIFFLTFTRLANFIEVFGVVSQLLRGAL